MKKPSELLLRKVEKHGEIFEKVLISSSEFAFQITWLLEGVFSPSAVL